LSFKARKTVWRSKDSWLLQRGWIEISLTNFLGCFLDFTLFMCLV
jgi:hypothetical protein